MVDATELMSKEPAHAGPAFLDGVFHRALDALEEVCVVIRTGGRGGRCGMIEVGYYRFHNCQVEGQASSSYPTLPIYKFLHIIILNHSQ